MAETIITNPQININDELILYVPNSLKFTPNTAKTVVKSLTAGGNSAVTVHSKDVTESTSKVTFSVKATERIIQLISYWDSNIGKNVIEISSQNGELAYAFTGMSLEENVELEFGADSEVELTFLGDPQ